MRNYWLIIAMVYFALAIASYFSSRRYSSGSKLKHSKIEIEGKSINKALNEYLNNSTWINVVGFVLAGFAAWISS